MSGDEKGCADAHDASLTSLEAIARSSAVPPFRKLLASLLLDHGHELRAFRVTRSAGETTVRLKASEAYLLYVAAMAAGQFDECVVQVTFRHGWPILSLDGVAAPSMTEAGAASSGPGGGDA